MINEIDQDNNGEIDFEGAERVREGGLVSFINLSRVLYPACYRVRGRDVA